MTVVPNVFQIDFDKTAFKKIKNCLPEHSVGKTRAILANKIIWRKKSGKANWKTSNWPRQIEHHQSRGFSAMMQPDVLDSGICDSTGHAYATIIWCFELVIHGWLQNSEPSGSFRRMTMFFFSFACIKYRATAPPCELLPANPVLQYGVPRWCFLVYECLFDWFFIAINAS